MDDFEKALVAEQGYLLRYAKKLTKNADRADDLLQATNLKALRFRDKFEPGTNFKGWVTTMMKFTFISDWRKADHIADLGEHTDNIIAGMLITKPNQHVRLELQDALDILAADHRNDRGRMVIDFELGDSYEEIQARYGFAYLNTVKSNMQRARHYLKLFEETGRGCNYNLGSRSEPERVAA